MKVIGRPFRRLRNTVHTFSLLTAFKNASPIDHPLLRSPAGKCRTVGEGGGGKAYDRSHFPLAQRSRPPRDGPKGSGI